MITSMREDLGLHADALMLRERRGSVLASNIANAATPHFKARDFDFAAELARVAFDEAIEINQSWTDFRGDFHETMPGRPVSFHAMRGISAHSNGFQTSREAGPQGLGYRVPVSPSLDGNTVEIGVEQVQFAENTTDYQASLTLLNRRISGLMTAIRGE